VRRLYAVSGGRANLRKVLEHYEPVLLDKMIVVTATCVILTYSLYTMSEKTILTHRTEALIYTVPFVMYGIFRYIYLLHQQRGGSDPGAKASPRSAHPVIHRLLVAPDALAHFLNPLLPVIA